MHARYREGETALHVASSKGHLNSVQALIAAGADVNAVAANGETALFGAAFKGHLEVARALIEAGARVTVKNNSGDTALMAAARSGHREVLQLLKASLSILGRIRFRLWLHAAGHGAMRPDRP